MSAVMILMVFTNIFVVGCLHAAYWQTVKYRDSMILEVTLKEEQVKEPEAEKIVSEYKRALIKTMIVGYITAVLVILPMKWYISIWLILYMLWMCGVIAVVQWVYIKYHKKLYQLKKDKGYICGKEVKEITIDTKLSIAKSKMAVSPLYFLIPILIVVLPLLNENLRNLLAEDLQMAWIILGTIALTKVLYIFMYYLFVKQRSVVYSENSEINIACNRVSKRGFSILFIAASTLDSIGYLAAFWDLISFQYISFLSVIVLVVIQLGIVALLFITLIQIKKKRDEIKNMDDSVMVVDEDEYWEKGYYYNPMDRRLFVPNRGGGMNIGFNMAKKSARIINGIFILGIAFVLIWTSVIVLRLDFVETKYIVEDNLQITAPSYSQTVEFEDIIAVKLIDELPDVKISKENGAATDQYSIGKFRIKNQGKCWLYIYHNDTPIVEVQTKESTIYFNSKTKGIAEECYKKLQEKIQESSEE